MAVSSDLLLSATLAGAVAIGATLAIERWGGRLGGIIGTLPSTIVPASLGFYATSQSPEELTASLAIVAPGMLVNGLFLLAWRIIPPKLPSGSLNARLALMTVLSLSLWAGCAAFFVTVMDSWSLAQTSPLLFGGLGFVLLGVLGIVGCLNAPPSPKGSKKLSPLTIASRGLLAAAAIAVAVQLSALGNPLLAGMASVFPAIFLTTMVSLWHAQGAAVPVGAVGPMMLGSTSVAAYALLAAWLMPAVGPAAGAALAWIAAVMFTSVPANAWLRRRRAA